MFKRLDSLVSEQLYCLVWCSNNSPEKRLTSNQTVSCGNSAFSNMSKAQREVFSLGCFTTCKKNQTCQLNVFKKKKKNPTHIRFPNSTETSPFQDILKKREKTKHPAIDLNRIKTLPKMITQANWNQLEPKPPQNILNMSRYTTVWQRARCTSNSSQKLFSEMDKV